MARTPEVEVTVIEQKGFCGIGHKVGDTWQIRGTTPAGICVSAWQAMFPGLRVIQLGGSFPWAKESGRVTVACPDAANPVVFEIRPVKGGQ
ncbi:MAG TPA: TIGR04076 family protein [Bacillota bacterium]|jgi:uncharacterized repeat protein (TIGR04076 family)